ncbi:MAG TPA: HD domain-containing protein [Ktedonobacterales bacterium]
MEREQLLAAARAHVRARLGDDSSGHDWRHVERVVRLARRLAEEEGADVFLCELAALTHDLADWKLNPDEARALEEVRDWLAQHEADAPTIARVMEIITHLSFKGGGQPPMHTLEGQIVQDADRLDAIGAIGIARAFAYGGAKGLLLHDPEARPRGQMTAEEYRGQQAATITHFHEKLLLLKDRMHTATARRLAAHRHAVLEAFLAEFEAEWEGAR